MSEQKRRITLAIVLAVISVFLLAGASYTFFPLQEPAVNPVILPLPQPTSPPGTPTDNQSNLYPALSLDVKMSQYPESTESFTFNMTPGETLKIAVTLSSLSNGTVFTVPLYLSVGAFENQPFVRMITSPPSPYPTLPWSKHDDSPNAPKPFEASFDANPLSLKPNERKTSVLTVTAKEDAQIGTYTMFVEMGNWEQTGLGGVTFVLEIMPQK